jgi:hypothetical protein
MRRGKTLLVLRAFGQANKGCATRVEWTYFKTFYGKIIF